MKDVLEEMQELAEKTRNAVIDSEGIYEKLVKKRDNAKSNTLKQLLNAELWEYVSLTKTMGKYLHLLIEKMNNDLESNSAFLKSSIEEIKTIENKQEALKMLELTRRTYLTIQSFNDIDILIINSSMNSYINVIDRNFKNWGEFAKKLGSKIADSVVDAIPGISEIKNICQNVIDTAELVNEFEDDATNYSEVDNILFEIEVHILVMQLSKILTEESIKILEK